MERLCEISIFVSGPQVVFRPPEAVTARRSWNSSAAASFAIGWWEQDDRVAYFTEPTRIFIKSPCAHLAPESKRRYILRTTRTVKEEKIRGGLVCFVLLGLWPASQRPLWERDSYQQARARQRHDYRLYSWWEWENRLGAFRSDEEVKTKADTRHGKAEQSDRIQREREKNKRIRRRVSEQGRIKSNVSVLLSVAEIDPG